MLAQGVMNFTVILTDYSFNLTSTQSASVRRNDLPFLNQLYNDVTSVRLFLVIIGFILILFLTFVIPNFSDNRYLFLLSYAIVVGKFLIPVWFLMGIEKSHIITYANTISRLITYSLIFTLVKSKGDYIIINLLWATGEIIIGLIGISFIKKNYKISTNLTFKWKPIQVQLHDGWAVFSTNALNALYINSNLFILSIFANGQILGSYAVAEKVMLLIKQIYGVLTQATYPYACRLAVVSQKEFNRFLTYEFYSCLIIFTGLGLLCFGEANTLIKFIVGKENSEAASLLRYLSFIPLIISLNLPAYQTLVINRFNRSYLPIIGVGAILNLLLNFLLVPLYLAIGTTISIAITEIFITVGLHVILFNKHTDKRLSLLPQKLF